MDLVNKIKIFPIFLILFMISCNDPNNEIYDYIEESGKFDGSDSCNIDLQKIFHIKFDTLYVFDGYSLSGAVPAIVNNEHNVISDGYIYGTEDERMIFIKNNKIVKDIRRKTSAQISFGSGIKIIKGGIFDAEYSDSLYMAKLYPTPILKVKKYIYKDKACYELDL